MIIKLTVTITLFTIALYSFSAKAGVSENYIDTDSLWQQGVNAYNAAKKAYVRQDGARAVSNYVDALAHLSAYYQRNPNLAGSNSRHAVSVRTVLRELEGFLSQLSASADTKGDSWGETSTPTLPPAPGGKLSKPPASSLSSAVFTNPRINGKRLDWCKSWSKECGKNAAISFCKRHGFKRTTKFGIAENIGAKDPTQVIVGGQVCNKGFCDGFSQIVCVQ
jgi:hypothetical protein